VPLPAPRRGQVPGAATLRATAALGDATPGAERARVADLRRR